MNGWIRPEKNIKGMRIDFGSGNPDEGEIQPNGFVLQDIQPHRGIDLVCDIRDASKYIENGRCSEARMSHCLEHFGTNEVVEVVKIIHRLLEKDGRLTIFVPNFLWHVQLVLEDKDKEAVHYAFGGQLDQYDFHKTAFTPKLLKNLLEENGFRVETMIGQTSISCVALKTSLEK